MFEKLLFKELNYYKKSIILDMGIFTWTEIGLAYYDFKFRLVRFKAPGPAFEVKSFK